VRFSEAREGSPGPGMTSGYVLGAARMQVAITRRLKNEIPCETMMTILMRKKIVARYYECKRELTLAEGNIQCFILDVSECFL
jgi:hypothetical protein